MKYIFELNIATGIGVRFSKEQLSCNCIPAHAQHHLAILVACIVFCALFSSGCLHTDWRGGNHSSNTKVTAASSYILVHWEPLQITCSYTLYCTIYFLTVAVIPFQTKLSIIIANSVTSPSTGKWSSPPTTGPRPPPCSNFSFTAINNHQAVLFGGGQPGRGSRVNDCYLMDFASMVWPDTLW